MSIFSSHNTEKKVVTALSTLALASFLSGEILAAEKGANKGKFYGDFRLRFEEVQQNNPLEDATGLTLRSRLGYITPSVYGFSGQIEVEDSRALIDDFSVPPSGFNTGEFSVIADPDSNTEIDQLLIKYNSNGFYGKLGRQVIVRENQRFIGHVGFRQDRQTFDALSLGYKAGNGLDFKFAYIDERNRIFSEDADLESEDILLDASYKTKTGKFNVFAYLLEVNNDTENGLDTYGISYKGAVKIGGGNKLNYAATLATQESTSADNEFDADYLHLEGKWNFSAPIWVKVGYELLGSDNGEFGFSTPLATLHKFNGFADVFINTPAQGIEDFYIGVGGKLSGFKWFATFHDFSSNESLNGSSDLGSEIDFGVSRKISKSWAIGAKAALFDAGDGDFNLIDTDRFWLWANYKFNVHF